MNFLLHVNCESQGSEHFFNLRVLGVMKSVRRKTKEKNNVSKVESAAFEDIKLEVRTGDKHGKEQLKKQHIERLNYIFF